jgi:hypothetical protein
MKKEKVLQITCLLIRKGHYCVHVACFPGYAALQLAQARTCTKSRQVQHGVDLMRTKYLHVNTPAFFFWAHSTITCINALSNLLW